MPVCEGSQDLTGILSFGSIHTASPASAVARARESALTWDMARVFTGLSPDELDSRNVRPGTRVVIHPDRRKLTQFGSHIASPFLDDRADLAAMIATLQILAEDERNYGHVVFAATAAEEVGGHGALYLLRRLQPEVGIALEIGPRVPESYFAIDGQPTVWVTDSYSAMRATDSGVLAEAAREIGLSPHWQALSRGGSDASCAASHGLLARPITLAFAAENSHGYEIMHRDAVPNLARFLAAVLDRVP
jgi:putative aminopeptidase FrvX